MRDKWHRRFLRLAYEISSWSKDEKSKMGAVIMGRDRTPRSFGYNGFPRGVNDDIKERHERPTKYKFFAHSEANAIYHCAKIGIPIDGCDIYITYLPCSDCSRAIIQSGIKRIFIPKNAKIDNASKWAEDWVYAKEMLDEAGVEINYVDMEEENGD